MKFNKKLISLFTTVLLLAVAACMVFAVGAENTEPTVSIVAGGELQDGVITLDAVLTNIPEGKSVEYFQLTLTPKYTNASYNGQLSTNVESLTVHGTEKGGVLTVVAYPSANGVAMANGTTVFSFFVKGVDAGDVLGYDVHAKLLYTDDTKTETDAVTTVTIPAGTYTTRLEAETHSVYWQYTDITNNKAGTGKEVGGVWDTTASDSYRQSFDALAGGEKLNKAANPMMSFTVDVAAEGDYTLDIVFRGGMGAGSFSDYFMALCVDDVASSYTKATYLSAHPTIAGYNIVQGTVHLTEGRHVIRVITMLSDTRNSTLKASWINIDFIDVEGPAAITPVLPQWTHLNANKASYIHNYKSSNDYLGGPPSNADAYKNAGEWWNYCLGTFQGNSTAANAGLTPENVTIYELDRLGYFSYTVNVPADGYYDLQGYIRCNWNNQTTGTMLLIVDSEVHKFPAFSPANTTHVADKIKWNAQNLSVYLTKGTHVLTVTGVVNNVSDWCDMGALSVSGGITLAEEQLDPTNVIAKLSDVYVDTTNGNDLNLGASADAPLATLAEAYNRVKDGGTIHIVGTLTADESFAWPASTTAVTVTGGTLDLGTLTKVNLNGPVTFGEVTIVLADSAEVFANGHKVVISENTIISATTTDQLAPVIFGGGDNGTRVASTDLTVLSGTWTCIYGGGAGAAGSANYAFVTGETNLTVGGNVNPNINPADHSISNHVYGGCRRGRVEGATNVTVNGGKISKVFGGGSGLDGGDWCDFAASNVTINGGTIMGVYGGNSFGAGYSTGTTVNVTVNGGNIEQVFGGTEWASLTGDVNIYLKGGTITRRVYGGCYNETSGLSFATSYHVKGTINLYIYDGVDITFTNSNNDRSVYAHSRWKPGSETEEISNLWYMDSAATSTKVGYQDDAMGLFMGSTSAADNIHTLVTSVSGTVLTRSCSCGCGHSDTVSVALDNTVSLDYTGSSVTPAVITHSGNWIGEKLQLVYTNNINEGTATAAVTYDGKSASVEFVIVDKYSHKLWNLTLKDDIAANFHVAVSDSYKDTAVMHISVNGRTVEVPVMDVQKDESTGCYVFTVNMAAAQMTDTITMQMYIDGVAGEMKTYTIRQYADYILADTTGEFTDEEKTLVKEMLNYGAAAQEYFGYNTGDLADAGITGTGAAAVPTETTAHSVSGSAEGASFYGASLVFKNKTAVRFYFTITGDIGDYTFTCNGTEYTPVKKGNQYYVEVDNIDPQELNRMFQVDVTKDGQTLSVNYSPMNYLVNVNKNTQSDAMRALLKALYNYHRAAVAYVLG